MSGFVTALALGYLAVALLPSGLLHLTRVRAFGAVVRAHGVLPVSAATTVAVLLAVTETGLGTAAVVAAVRGDPPPALFAAAVLLGAGFLLYLRAVLRRPDPGVGCGCTPLPAPLGPVSLLPAGMLTVVATPALAATVTTPTAGPAGPAAAFPVLWGATLALLAILVAASVPSPAAEAGS